MTSSLDRFEKTVWRQLAWIATEQFSRSPQRPSLPQLLPQVVSLARVSITNLYRSALICLITGLMMVVLAACGGSTQDGVTDEPTTARVLVTEVQVSSAGDRIESITIRTDEGKDLHMRLGGTQNGGRPLGLPFWLAALPPLLPHLPAQSKIANY